MRKIIIGAFVSMDGIMQASGGPTEDPTKGFKFGGWEMPFFDQESREEIDRLIVEFARDERASPLCAPGAHPRTTEAGQGSSVARTGRVSADHRADVRWLHHVT
jgi:hypothetical protein